MCSLSVIKPFLYAHICTQKVLGMEVVSDLRVPLDSEKLSHETSVTHCLGMNYYVNFLGGIDSNGFHII